SSGQVLLGKLRHRACGGAEQGNIDIAQLGDILGHRNRGIKARRALTAAPHDACQLHIGRFEHCVDSEPPDVTVTHDGNPDGLAHPLYPFPLQTYGPTGKPTNPFSYGRNDSSSQIGSEPAWAGARCQDAVEYRWRNLANAPLLGNLGQAMSSRKGGC